MMWKQHEPLLEQVFWGGDFWVRSLYVGTEGMSSRTVERYIDRTEHG